jgi:hypothetical protein
MFCSSYRSLGMAEMQRAYALLRRKSGEFNLPL